MGNGFFLWRSAPRRFFGVDMEKFIIGLAFFIFAFATGYMYGNDLGKAENDAVISRASEKLKRCNMVLAGIYDKGDK